MAKTKSFLGSRSTTPSSATDHDFEEALGITAPGHSGSAHIFSQDIPVERLRPNPFQARQTFTDLEELAESIREQGFISRLRVRPDPLEVGYFQLVYGERRLRAALLAGLTLLPCDVASYTDKQLIEIGLLENIQRQDLNPLEEAQAFQRFIEQGNYKIRELAQRIGKNKDYIAGRLALLQAPSDVQDLVIARPEALSAARRIAQLPEQTDRVSLIEGILNGELNTQQVRNVVQSFQTQQKGMKARAAQSTSPAQAGELITEITSVRLDVQNDPSGTNSDAAKKGKTPAHFITAEETQKNNYSTSKSEFQQEVEAVLKLLDGWEQTITVSPDQKHQQQKRHQQKEDLLDALQLIEEKLTQIRRVASAQMSPV